MHFVQSLGEHEFSEQHGAYSRHQDHRNVRAINVWCWPLSLKDNLAIILWCNAINGAFDRVYHARLYEKMRVNERYPASRYRRGCRVVCALRWYVGVVADVCVVVGVRSLCLLRVYVH